MYTYKNKHINSIQPAHIWTKEIEKKARTGVGVGVEVGERMEVGVIAGDESEMC